MALAIKNLFRQGYDTFNRYGLSETITVTVPASGAIDVSTGLPAGSAVTHTVPKVVFSPVSPRLIDGVNILDSDVRFIAHLDNLPSGFSTEPEVLTTCTVTRGNGQVWRVVGTTKTVANIQLRCRMVEGA